MAAFGQPVRGGKYTGALGYDDIHRLAQDARGTDAFGYCSEFVSLDGGQPAAAAVTSVGAHAVRPVTG